MHINRVSTIRPIISDNKIMVMKDFRKCYNIMGECLLPTPPPPLPRTKKNYQHKSTKSTNNNKKIQTTYKQNNFILNRARLPNVSASGFRF